MDQSNQDQNQNPRLLRPGQPAELPPLPEGVSYETVVEKPQDQGQGPQDQEEGPGEGKVAVMVSEALTEEGEPVVLLWVKGGPQIKLKPQAAFGIGMLLVSSAEDALSDAAHLSQLKNGAASAELSEEYIKAHLESARNLREQWRDQGWRGGEFEND